MGHRFHRQHNSPEAGSPASLPLLVIGIHVSAAGKENPMPRRKSLLTIIRDLVQQEVRAAIQSLLGTISPRKTKPKNGRRRRKRGRSPGRPPGSKNKKA
jgi:hypothetical protein